MKKNSEVYFIGIGGIGMSSLAKYFKATGWDVSGSDLEKSEITTDLAKRGIKVFFGQKKAHLPRRTALAIRTQAAPENNPDVSTASKNKVPLLTYPQAVGSLTTSYKTICVAGAHGKSTTAALCSLVLLEGGFDPTVIIGTRIKEFGNSNFRFGKSRYLVLEADEYGKAFLEYHPTIAVVTNIDSEHLDTYKNLSDVRGNFFKFLSRTIPGGALILNRDDKNLFLLKNKIEALGRANNYDVSWYSLASPAGKKLGGKLKIPGIHNLSNAAAAAELGKIMRIPAQKIVSALTSFAGSWRRLELKAKINLKPGSIIIYDDYAHHPTEIKASLAALKSKYPKSKIICVFQPHQSKRLNYLFQEFAASFADASAAFILPVYGVAGRDARGAYDSRSLAAAIMKKNPDKPVYYVPNPELLNEQLEENLRTQYSGFNIENFIIIMMGAGNINKLTPPLINYLRRKK